MVGRLLLRGMLVGILAGLLCFGFLKTFGEPQVDRAIAFETQMDEAKAAADKAAGIAMPADEPELVSRRTQAGLGLFTGVTVYSAAFGGLFALAFALVNGRVGSLGARANAALLAVAGFVSVYLVPNLKYPANPPSVGDPATIGARTELYFAEMALSLAAMIAAVLLFRRLAAGWGPGQRGARGRRALCRGDGRLRRGASGGPGSARGLSSRRAVAVPGRLDGRPGAALGDTRHRVRCARRRPPERDGPPGAAPPGRLTAGWRSA